MHYSGSRSRLELNSPERIGGVSPTTLIKEKPMTEHPKHGMTEEVQCKYVPVSRNTGAWVRSMEDDRVKKLQMVKLLIYEGKVVRNFCPHLQGEDCGVQLKKKCHLAPGK